MSDIIKRISSIEAEDKHIGAALGLGLRPLDDDSLAEIERTGREFENTAPKAKPLGLTPIEDDILDLEELSLEVEDEALERPIEMHAESSPLLLRPIGERQEPPIANKPPPRSSAPILPPEDNLPGFLDIEKDPLPEALPVERAAPAPSVTSAASFAAPLAAASAAAPKAVSSSKTGVYILILGLLGALLWLVCSGLIAFDVFGAADRQPKLNNFQKLGFAVIVAVPLLLIGITTYALRQLAHLSQKAEHLQITAQAMMTPDDSVIARSTIMAKSIQAQVDDVNMKVSSALNRMELLDDMVKSQNSSLSKSTISIETTTNSIEGRINTQRESLENVATLFESRMAQLSDMLDGHTQQLFQSGQKAEQRVQEARISVENAAEKISGASETVRQNAIAAAQTLSGSQVEITNLGESVQNQSIKLDSVYRQHLRDLQIMLTELRTQQDELGATMEERLSKMRDMSLSAKVGAESLTEASIKGRETVEALNEAASLTDTAVRARFSEMEEMVKYSTARAESISDTAARQVQNSLSSTRKEIARIETDMLDLMDKLNRTQSANMDLNASASTANIAPVKSAAPREAQPQSPQPDSKPELRLRPANPPAAELPITAEYSHSPDMDAAPSFNESLYTPGHGASGLDEQSHIDTSLDVHTPIAEDLPDALRRPVKSNDEPKNRWKWKGIFPAAEKGKGSPVHYSPVTDESIIQSLSALGLSPSAIVDDGCIIEAANLRKVKGALAMSEAITKRLGEPVRHLFRAAEKDPEFKTNIRAFTDQFHARLMPVENDREAIRAKLESESGRAFLLCDAALNG